MHRRRKYTAKEAKEKRDGPLCLIEIIDTRGKLHTVFNCVDCFVELKSIFKNYNSFTLWTRCTLKNLEIQSNWLLSTRAKEREREGERNAYSHHHTRPLIPMYAPQNRHKIHSIKLVGPRVFVCPCVRSAYCVCSR